MLQLILSLQLSSQYKSNLGPLFSQTTHLKNVCVSARVCVCARVCVRACVLSVSVCVCE
jgi:hypothetical protein